MVSGYTAPSRIPTGCREIDSRLRGGIPTGSVTLVYGEAETGKSTLAMQCAVNCALQARKTLFLDCDGSFSVNRFYQIIPATSSPKDISELIILLRPENFDEQGTVMDRLPDYVGRSFGLLVIDTFSSLYRAQVAESPQKTFNLNRELNRQMALVAQCAKTNRIGVLALSQVRSAFGEGFPDVEPVPTRVLRFWADIALAMRPTESSRVLKAFFEKPEDSDSLPFILHIGEKGIY